MGIHKPRTPQPGEPTQTLCPGCAHQPGMVVQPGCPICAGVGTLTLGPRALAYDPPEVVAAAVHQYLLDTARNLVEHRNRNGYGPTRTGPETIQSAVTRLTNLGLIAGRGSSR